MGLVMELVDVDSATIVEELKDMNYVELQRVSRGLSVIQNIASEFQADIILKEGR